jgi:hypothetical protein
MSLEGLRAWIGEVERKLGKRTRVFLALAAIAIGLGGAAIYLAIDARENSVSESDVQALQEKLERRIDEAIVTPAPEAEGTEAVPAPKPEGQAPEEAQPGAEGGKKGSGASGTSGGSSGSTGGASGAVPNGATGGAPSSAKLQELLEQAKKHSEQIEKEEATAP